MIPRLLTGSGRGRGNNFYVSRVCFFFQFQRYLHIFGWGKRFISLSVWGRFDGVRFLGKGNLLPEWIPTPRALFAIIGSNQR